MTAAQTDVMGSARQMLRCAACNKKCRAGSYGALWESCPGVDTGNHSAGLSFSSAVLIARYCGQECADNHFAALLREHGIELLWLCDGAQIPCGACKELVDAQAPHERCVLRVLDQHGQPAKETFFGVLCSPCAASRVLH